MGKHSFRAFTIALAIVVALTFVAGFTPFADLFALPLVRSEEPSSADAIVVLGGGVRKSDGAITRATAERVVTGFGLWRNGMAPTLAFTGGQVPGNRFNEARQVESVFRNLGVPDESRILEDASRNTYENAVNVRAIAQAKGWDELLVVTSPFHTRRACGVFEKLGMAIRCVAADPSVLSPPSFIERIGAMRSVIREYGATVYFMLKGYL